MKIPSFCFVRFQEREHNILNLIEIGSLNKPYFYFVKKSWLHKWHAVWVWLTNCIVIFQIISFSLFWCNLMLTFSSRWASFLSPEYFNVMTKTFAKYDMQLFMYRVLFYKGKLTPYMYTYHIHVTNILLKSNFMERWRQNKIWGLWIFFHIFNSSVL